MKNKFRNVFLISALVILLPSSGCLHARLDRSQELLNHPQFESAVLAAPAFVEKALEIVVELEAEIERK